MSSLVLIIDDDPRISMALGTRLEARGHEVHFAACGRSGVETARAMRPDAIVLDIRMPDMDGFEVCTKLREQPGLKDTPVIFFSANSEDSSRSRAARVGGNLFLSKPGETRDVVTAIDSLTTWHLNPSNERTPNG